MASELVSRRVPILLTKMSLSELPGIGKLRAERLEKLGLVTCQDLVARRCNSVFKLICPSPAAATRILTDYRRLLVYIITSSKRKPSSTWLFSRRIETVKKR